jgi:hypothetical protein
MPFFYSDVITGARKLVNDTAATSYRVSDADMLTFVKEGVLELAVYRPDNFESFGTVTCAAGCLQQITSTRAITVIDVLGINGGAAIEQCDYEALRRFRPGYRTDTAGAAENWFRYPEDDVKRDKTRFGVYPPAAVGQVLDVAFAEAPDQSGVNTANMAATAVPVNDEFLTALEQFVAHKVESIDDESAHIERAQAFYNQFVSLIGASRTTSADNP